MKVGYPMSMKNRYLIAFFCLFFTYQIWSVRKVHKNGIKVDSQYTLGQRHVPSRNVNVTSTLLSIHTAIHSDRCYPFPALSVSVNSFVWFRCW